VSRETEPQRPELPEDVRAWIEERLGDGCAITALAEAGDLPPNVAAWYAAHNAWRDEREAWARRQPFDWSNDRYAWRMFGGPWLGGQAYVERVSDDGERYVHHLAGTVDDLTRAGVPEAELRRIAAAIYEWRAMDRRAQENIAEMLGKAGAR